MTPRCQASSPHPVSTGHQHQEDTGELWFAAGAWGDTLGRRGGLTIKQSRLGWLPFLPTLPGTQASFIVGTFRTAEVADGDPPLGAFGA